MARITVIALFLVVCWQTLDLSTSEREVLIRDRLVLVLCDQIEEYLSTGKFPGPVQKMPEKYKKIKPGKAGRMDGFKVLHPDSTKRKRQTDDFKDHPILDFMYL